VAKWEQLERRKRQLEEKIRDMREGYTIYWTQASSPPVINSNPSPPF
jgi:hypothetical protein